MPPPPRRGRVEEGGKAVAVAVGGRVGVAVGRGVSVAVGLGLDVGVGVAVGITGVLVAVKGTGVGEADTPAASRSRAANITAARVLNKATTINTKPVRTCCARLEALMGNQRTKDSRIRLAVKVMPSVAKG